MNFLILHGTFGGTDENWFPWLKQELEKLGHRVFLPQLPTEQGKQNPKEWTKVIEKLDIPFDSNLAVVAHSLSPVFALSLLEKRKARACFFISGYISMLSLEEVIKRHPSQADFIKRAYKVNKEFIKKKFDWNAIRENCPLFVMYHGDNDPYVPMEHARELAEKLGTEVKTVKKGGHLNSETGYNKFPQLLEDIKSFLATV